MLDALKIYRKFTSKVNDFSPEQLQNLICIVNLYRGKNEKFRSTVKEYTETAVECASALSGVTYLLREKLQEIIKTISVVGNGICQPLIEQINETMLDFEDLFDKQKLLEEKAIKCSMKGELLEDIAHLCKNIRKPQDKLFKQLLDVISAATKEYQLNKNKDWKELNLKEQLDQLKALQQKLSGNPDEEEPGLLHETEYFYKQAYWLTSRFPEGVYTDVEGLCKVVSQKDIESKDWSLSPGRYVGVDTSTDEDFDYEERLNEIHIELEGLNEEAISLAKTISENYKELSI